MNRSQGFTLIELLVVISIVGTLSSVVLSTVNVSRAKATNAGAMKIARSLLPLLTDCLNEGYTRVDPVVGQPVCTGGNYQNSRWPTLPAGWFYESGFPGAAPVNPLFVIGKPAPNNKMYYMGCGWQGCEITGPVDAYP